MDPKVLDFSAPAEEAITIKFPNGETCELPTVDQLSMSALQFLTAHGDEWFKLFQAADLSDDQRTRFGHLNEKCVRALCDGVSQEALDGLGERQKARVIVGFMTASPETITQLQEMIEAGQATS